MIWLHCVSVGETNAARPLVDSLLENFPDHRLVFSTTTKTGQDLAQKIFIDKVDAIVYFPFDFKFSVRRALGNFKPSLVLLMETEIWPRFIREAKDNGAKVAIVNGRLSERSFARYSKILTFISRVLADVDLALMQSEADARRLISLGMAAEKTAITGNLKFDLALNPDENVLTEEFRQRFGLEGTLLVIVAASTHEPEEQWVLDALEVAGYPRRVIFAPRHPERFDSVAELLSNIGIPFVRRSKAETEADKTSEVILLDSVGELRAIYPLADIVFVGGSLIPHGGQSVLEPAAAGKAIIVGPYTHNFEAVVTGFLENNAIIQTKIPMPIADRPSDPSGIPLPPSPGRDEVSELYFAMTDFLGDADKRAEFGERALQTINTNRGATVRTAEYLNLLFE